MNDIDKHIFELRKRKDMLLSLERLINNADFKKVINEYYLTKHPLELVKSKGVLNLSPETNLSIDRQLEAVALFNMYLEQAMDELPDIDIKINEAIAHRDEQTRNT